MGILNQPPFGGNHHDDDEHVEIEYTARIRVRRSQIASLLGLGSFAVAQPPPNAASECAPRLLTKCELGRALNVSNATIDRFAREGMPFVPVGSHRRFELEACRMWLAARGAKPTTPKPSLRPENDAADDDPIELPPSVLRDGGFRPATSTGRSRGRAVGGVR
jgi:hypothetical protein